MTNTPATSSEYVTRADARRRQVRAAHVIFAGAATLALTSATLPHTAEPAVASASVAAADAVSSHSPTTIDGRVVAIDDDNGNSVNDQGQTSGDIFTQNAQDQSTA